MKKLTYNSQVSIPPSSDKNLNFVYFYKLKIHKALRSREKVLLFTGSCALVFLLPCHLNATFCIVNASTYNTIASTYNANASIYNVIASTYNAIVSIYNAIVSICNAIVSTYNANASIYNTIVATFYLQQTTVRHYNAHPTIYCYYTKLSFSFMKSFYTNPS